MLSTLYVEELMQMGLHMLVALMSSVPTCWHVPSGEPDILHTEHHRPPDGRGRIRQNAKSLNTPATPIQLNTTTR